MPQPIYLSREGLEKLRSELEHLRTARRQDAAARIQQSRERGGTVSNAEYEEAKNELAFTEGRILTLDNMLNNAIIIDETRGERDTVEVGATVSVTGPEREVVQVHHNRKRGSGPVPRQNLQRFSYRQEPLGKARRRSDRGQHSFGENQAGNSQYWLDSRLRENDELIT